MSTGIHIPGRPTLPEPPDLAKTCQAIHHPNIVRTGVTTTKDGRWALLVVVKRGTHTPVEGLNNKGYPVIYQPEPARMPVARPAYPGLGE